MLLLLEVFFNYCSNGKVHQTPPFLDVNVLNNIGYLLPPCLLLLLKKHVFSPVVSIEVTYLDTIFAFEFNHYLKKTFHCCVCHFLGLYDHYQGGFSGFLSGFHEYRRRHAEG